MAAKRKINLMLLQTAANNNSVAQNIKNVKGQLECSLSGKEVDFVFLPEVWSVGWCCEDFQASANSIENSPEIEMLKEIAKAHNVNIIGGSVIIKSSNGKYYNTSPIILRTGQLLCTYEKNHLYSYYGDNEGGYITAGKNPVLVEIEGVKLGISICYDIRFPEIYRAYRKANADILVNMAAWGYKKRLQWDTMTCSRAIENQTYFVALTQTGVLKNGERNVGHSMFYDYNGNVMGEITDIEGAVYATVDLDEMYEFRNKCTILNDIKESYEVIKV